MSRFRSLAIWAAEMLSEAVGTALWMAALVRIESGSDHGSYPYGYLGVLLGMSCMVFIEFALTGYLVTTLLLALYLPRHNRYLYPVISLVLYLLHSTIFFFAVGNRPGNWGGFNILTGIGGSLIAAVFTFAGDSLRRSDLVRRREFRLDKPQPAPLV